MKFVKVDVNIDELHKIASMFAKGLTENAFPNTAESVKEARDLAKQKWKDYLAGESSLDGIEPVEKPNLKMVQSVKSEKKSAFNYSVYSENQQIEKIIEGEPAVNYDMKKTHPYGRKSRVSKKGVPYLIINFRWGTPNEKGGARARWNNFIPQKVYNTSLKKILRSKSETTGLTHPELNFKGQAIDRNEYNWGGRLTENDAWDDRSVGMVRMKDSANGKSVYFTFRIISAKSPQGSWIYHKDAKAPVDMIGALKRTVESDIRKIIEEGIKADVEMYMN